ncbi:MAG TPA: thioredoxin domain-containing protein [Acidimicrobiia bacterium]|nr:thioredoxin domain-containing protein [Acidimicrobiia bacterium]
MNKLADETSPYLRQHAGNPVEWMPWSDEAFALARERDVPVFLSVGYSSCHWCHVMAHESFEDDATAAVMNRLFVNVKVDREERPDVDAIYMQSVQALTGRGGWPMSVWCAPDGRPFYAGTYFPSEERHGMPAFRRVCEAVSEAWHDRREEVLQQSEQLTAAIAEDVLRPEARATLTPELLTAAYAGVKSQFEPRYGGFGRAPKFPQAMTIDFVCRSFVRNSAADTREMITATLDGMAAGGIHDQLGGGFARYSTDDFWLVPHFEKMLYDNALLTRAYLHGYLATGESRYRSVVEDIVGYVLRDLRHANGGFYAAEDADSEGVEGKFYCWSIDEIREVCGDDADAVIRYFGVTEQGNFVDPHTGFRGNILHVVDPSAEVPPEVDRAKAKLLERRSGRVRPGLDDKILLAWNALMLDALARAAAAFEREDWMAAARTNARFLLGELRRDDGRFVRSWRAPHLAYAEDYAALLEALLTMAEVDDPGWLPEARAVADELLRLFHDADGRGFFTTGHDAEPLVVRPKDVFDDATPSANSLAANGLLRLAALTGETRYETPAVDVAEMLARPMASQPTAFAHMLEACERILTPPLEIAIVGLADDPRTRALQREVHHRLLPGSVTLTGPASDASPLLDGREARDLVPTAYVCEHYACRQPVTSPEDLRAQLDAVLAGRDQRSAS